MGESVLMGTSSVFGDGPSLSSFFDTSPDGVVVSLKGDGQTAFAGDDGATARMSFTAHGITVMVGGAGAVMGGGAFLVGRFAFAAMGGISGVLARSFGMNGGAFTLPAMGCAPDALDAEDGRPLLASVMGACGLRWSSPIRGDAILLALDDLEPRLRS